MRRVWCGKINDIWTEPNIYDGEFAPREKSAPAWQMFRRVSTFNAISFSCHSLWFGLVWFGLAIVVLLLLSSLTHVLHLNCHRFASNGYWVSMACTFYPLFIPLEHVHNLWLLPSQPSLIGLLSIVLKSSQQKRTNKYVLSKYIGFRIRMAYVVVHFAIKLVWVVFNVFNVFSEFAVNFLCEMLQFSQYHSLYLYR